MDTPAHTGGPARLTVSWGHLSAATVAILRAAEQGFAGAGGTEVQGDCHTPGPWVGEQGQGDTELEMSRDRERGPGWETGRQRSLASRTGLSRAEAGHGGAAHTDTPAHGDMHTETGRDTPESRAQTPALWFPPWPPHLRGLGRGLGREAGAGTFRDPAVSVMRLHQLSRQASPWALRAPDVLPGPPPSPSSQGPGPCLPPVHGTPTPLLLPL